MGLEMDSKERRTMSDWRYENVEVARRAWVDARPKPESKPLFPMRRCYREGCDELATGFYDSALTGPAAAISDPRPACDAHKNGITFGSYFTTAGSEDPFAAGFRLGRETLG